MSYQDFSKGGRELRDVGPSSEDQGVTRLISDIFRLQTEVSRLSTEVDKLNGPSDTVALRRKVAATLQRLQTTVKGLNTSVKHAHTVNPTQQTTKLVNDFEGVLLKFQEVMKEAKRREAASLPIALSQTPASSSGAAPPPESTAIDIEKQAAQKSNERAQDRGIVPGESACVTQRAKSGSGLRQPAQSENRGIHDRGLLAVNTQLEYNEALIEEREQGIAEIAQQIGEVNEIFQDLAVLVNDQGLMLDDIEANIVRTAERTREAGGELLRAERYQKSARNKTCLILAAVAFVLTILVIVLTV